MVRVIRIPNTWIPASDGTRLAARIWLPAEARERPVPAILECAPYRKDDYLERRDEARHGYMARHGYACVRVDVRGTGSSEGVLRDEYSPREQEDMLDVLRWIREQSWCSGSVGMIGVSWSGFAALQAAVHRPPGLRAIVVVAASDDRYETDAHYAGGCILACELLPWAARMFAYNARPPDPHVVGERWRKLWLERLERQPLFAERWLRHQRTDAYWEAGSVSTDYSRIACPALLVGGWHDPYREAILRLLERLECPRRAIVGPWSHQYPDAGRPGPAVGFLQECLRWWDQWLGGVETGVMKEPFLRAWMPEATPPGAVPADDAGRWVAEDSWPPSSRPTTLYLTGAQLTKERRKAPARSLRARQSTGLAAGVWVPCDAAELPKDQARDDAQSLCYTSEPLAERVEILGTPSVELTISADRPLALVAIRVCDVFPDGSSALVTHGQLNLTRRGGLDRAEALLVETPFRVKVPLQTIAHSFPAGHRLRVSVSPAYWPWAWPSPEPVSLTVHGGGDVLTLPVRPSGAHDADVRFELPRRAPVPSCRIVRDGRNRMVLRSLGRQRWRLDVERDIGGHRVLASGLELAHWNASDFRIDDDDPLSAEVRTGWQILLRRNGWRTQIETDSSMSADRGFFRITNELEAREGARVVARRSESFAVPRDFG